MLTVPHLLTRCVPVLSFKQGRRVGLWTTFYGIRSLEYEAYSAQLSWLRGLRDSTPAGWQRTAIDNVIVDIQQRFDNEMGWQ